MIINSSRDSLFQTCRQKMWNWDILGLLSHREADPLMIGEAAHAGKAKYYETGNIVEATEEVERVFRKRLEGQMILPEEHDLIERNIKLARKAIEKYAHHWKGEPLQVLMSEVKFLVELPNSHHHCFFLHSIEHPEIPFSECPVEHNLKGQQHWGDLKSEESFHCYQPHFFTGRCDAVVSWRNMVWIDETKTATISRTGDIFYDRFHLDTQTTGYIYGVWKSSKLRPHGFILNVIKKPPSNASDPFNLTFEREPYIRDDKSLLEFEEHILRVARNYERAIVERDIFKNTQSCTSYNRRCYYMNLCKRHNEVEEGEFRQRPVDYVQAEYYKLLGKEISADVIPHDVSDPA